MFYDRIGHYFSGDGAYRDKDGFYHIAGRMDDVINVSGHRLGTAEIEDILVLKIHVNPVQQNLIPRTQNIFLCSILPFLEEGVCSKMMQHLLLYLNPLPRYGDLC